ncbi:MAG: RNA polymerase factor sigma-54 [Bdellovibrionota bacterium]
MGVGMKQSMNLSQTLRMTPQLQQAIKLLQLSRMELETAVRKEIEENPVLEELAGEGGEDQASTQESQVAAGQNEGDIVQDQNPQKQDEFDWESYLDTQYKPTPSMGGGNEEIMNYENLISTTQTLYDHLMWQMRNSGFNDEEQTLASILISYIDDDGYIKVPLEQISEDEGCNKDDLESVLPFVQEFDPPGIGARDLKECLLIQAKHIQEDTRDFVALISNHLKDLEKKNYEGIARAMGRDLEEIIDMTKIIYSMDPKPGRQFLTNDTQYVTPDVYVYKVGDEYMVSLNEDGLPRLRISNFYKAELQKKVKGVAADSTQEYIQEKLRSAVWLIKSIHQRQRTIYKVTESIVKHQRDFFDRGPGFIKPMILRDIANDIGMHESTVSRVTTAKYVHTPRGIFELKYFFNSGINTDDGDSLASESVKLKIKELVAVEDPKVPLSDQKIVDLLKKEGIQIARRTVAKYRDVLKILPSSKRKKYF